jgi:hypothetical protein
MKLNTLHQSRWNAAVKLLSNLKAKCKSTPGALLMYDGDLIQEDQIVITEDEIKVKSGTSTYEVFIADPLYDSGLYKSVKEFNTEVKERFKLVKILKY